MQLVDSHCHIQDALCGASDDMYAIWQRAERSDPDDIIAYAATQSVTRILCVGTTLADSRAALAFASTRNDCWASIGLHPHEAKCALGQFEEFKKILSVSEASDLQTKEAGKTSAESGSDTSSLRVPEGLSDQGKSIPDGAHGSTSHSKLIAIGECGLDYHYNHADPISQTVALRFQIELALEHNLPLIFHVREAFDDFWPIFDSYPNIRGVLHSYTDTRNNLTKALERGLYIGQNGIVTFSKDPEQLAVVKAIPIDNLLLETDAPFLTPVPRRGTINEPANVRLVAEFLANIRGESLEQIASSTTSNAERLFAL